MRTSTSDDEAFHWCQISVRQLIRQQDKRWLLQFQTLVMTSRTPRNMEQCEDTLHYPESPRQSHYWLHNLSIHCYFEWDLNDFQHCCAKYSKEMCLCTCWNQNAKRPHPQASNQNFLRMKYGNAIGAPKVNWKIGRSISLAVAVEKKMLNGRQNTPRTYCA